MTDNCQLLPMDQITPGMRLAEAIRDRFGNLMLPEGTRLTEQNLGSLQQRGIASAMIACEPPPLTPEQQQARIQSIKERLDYLFRKSSDSELNRQLKEMILTYRMESFK